MRLRRGILVVTILVATLMFVPMASAEPDPPSCYDNKPIVDAGIVQVWFTRGGTVRVVTDPHTCTVGDLYVCP